MLGTQLYNMLGTQLYNMLGTQLDFVKHRSHTFYSTNGGNGICSWCFWRNHERICPNALLSIVRQIMLTDKIEMMMVLIK